jgi:hypothetical protein
MHIPRCRRGSLSRPLGHYRSRIDLVQRRKQGLGFDRSIWGGCLDIVTWMSCFERDEFVLFVQRRTMDGVYNPDHDHKIEQSARTVGQNVVKSVAQRVARMDAFVNDLKLVAVFR